jgi:peptide/nickel transport system substrate-binding protein/microcin C transport system substrate-binding protein
VQQEVQEMYDVRTMAGFVGLVLSVAAATGSSTPLGNPQAPQGGTLYYNLSAEPPTLNPITSTDGAAARVHSYVMDALMYRDEDTYGWQPALAEQVETSADGRTYTFTIRQGARFHDGKEITAEDVKFSFDVIFIDEFQAFHIRPYYENIDSATVVDKYTVTFTTKNVYFGNFNALAGLTVLPKHVYGNVQKAKKMNKDVVGSGPYILDQYDKGRKIVLERNQKWWGNDLPPLRGKYNVATIVMKFVKEENIALTMLEKGELDSEVLSPEAYVKKTTGKEWGTKVFKVKVENKSPKGYGFVGWNLRSPLFQAKNVRIALAHLMNRALMNDKFRFGMSLLATGPWYQHSEYADPTVKPILYDPAKALELLRGEGWHDTDKDGILDREIDGNKVDFAFTLLNPNKDFEKYLVLYQGDLAKVGIRVEIKLLEWNTFITKLDEAQFDAVALAWSGGSVDLDPKQVWHSSSAVKGGSNFIGYKNPDVDRLIDEARQELDKQKRIPMLQQVYRKVAEDAPYAFLFNNPFTLYAHTARVHKVRDTFTYNIGSDFWWIQREAL